MTLSDLVKYSMPESIAQLMHVSSGIAGIFRIPDPDLPILLLTPYTQVRWYCTCAMPILPYGML